MTTRNRREKHAGTDEYAGMVKRMLRAYVRKVQNNEADVTALEQLADIQKELDQRTAEVVAALREQGVSWAQIGEYLGMNRTAAYNKFEARKKAS